MSSIWNVTGSAFDTFAIGFKENFSPFRFIGNIFEESFIAIQFMEAGHKAQSRGAKIGCYSGQLLSQL